MFNIKLHEILGYAAIGIMFMWLLGWNVLNALMKYFIGFSLAPYIHIPLWLMLVTTFVLILAAGFAKYRYDNKPYSIPIEQNNESNESQALTDTANTRRTITDGILSRPSNSNTPNDNNPG